MDCRSLISRLNEYNKQRKEIQKQMINITCIEKLSMYKEELKTIENKMYKLLNDNIE